MRRKSTKTTRGPNADEKRFQEWLKHHPCCITGDYGVEVHHCKGSTWKENKVLVGHWFCIPLTPELHKEYHSGTKAFRDKYGKQCDLWKKLITDYALQTGHIVPQDVFDAIMSIY